MASVDCIYQVILNLGRNLCGWSLYVLCEELDSINTLNAFEFIAELVLPVGYHIVQSLNILLWQGKNHLCLEWDGVAHVAAVPGSQTSIKL